MISNLSWIELILFIFVSCSVTNIITSEYIFEPIRDIWQRAFKRWDKIKYLISCPVCLGFWVGLALSFAFHIHCLIGALITSLCMKVFVIYENRG